MTIALALVTLALALMTVYVGALAIVQPLRVAPVDMFALAQERIASAVIDHAHASMMARIAPSVAPAPSRESMALLGSLVTLATLPAPTWSRAECPMVADVRAMRTGAFGGLSVALTLPVLATFVAAFATVL